MPDPRPRLNQALARRFHAAEALLKSMGSSRRKYLIAVSAGCDSVVLLHWLRSLGYGNLVVCHVNHHLRGSASHQDGQFVRRLANRLELVCHLVDAPLSGTGSVETEARELRYEQLAKLSRQERCDRVFLAHHADDQAETVLWNLMRGCGLEGLSGMASMTKREIAGKQLWMLRPLLALDRDDLRGFAKAYRLHWREDESNQDPAFLRNRIRHQLLPMMEEVSNRPVKRALGQLAEVAREEHRVMEALVRPVAPVPTVAELRLWPVAIQRRWLLRWLRSQNVPDLSHHLIETIRPMLSVDGPAKVNLPGGRHCRRTRGRLYLEPGS